MKTDSQWWDEAIRDAEEELRIARRRVLQLRTAIRILRANKKDGVKWPVSST